VFLAGVEVLGACGVAAGVVAAGIGLGASGITVSGWMVGLGGGMLEVGASGST